MKITKQLINLISEDTASIEYEEVDTCPICKAKISPRYLYSILYETKENQQLITVVNYCTGCNSVFICKYEVIKKRISNTYEPISLLSSEPNCFVEEKFEDDIKALSPNFVEIFNQALAAETMSLNQIAGIGYRKALEFLTKDFAISEYPDKEEIISNMPLAKCISDYIDDIRIKTLALKSAWLGNDETHYVRKHVDNDVDDMKAFIKAMVYFISMVLITKTADAIESK